MTAPRPARLGVFGGTFDPPHVGHLVVARDAAERLGLDRLLLVVAARPPHKPTAGRTPPEIRLEMVRVAVAGDGVLEASDAELERPGPSYMVETLRELADRSGATLFLLIGVDQWREIRTWKDAREIGRLATIAVLARGGEDPASIDPGVGLSYEPVPVTRIDVSSSEIRARVREGRSIRYLVPAAVEEIIRSRALYGRGDRGPSAQTTES